ncbi:MAG: TlpA disulfide reductase family protein [Planctomycetota bacterium]
MPSPLAHSSVRRRFAGLASIVASCFVSGVAVADADGVLREGTGTRRADLNAMELKSFDPGLWSELSGWSNGGALNATETDGKVVVIYTFSSFLPQSQSPIVRLDRLQRKHADDGLIVLGVHHPERFEGAEALMQRRRATFRFAHDSSGAFRDALKVDQDPDFYIIDRAGQLRYADIETGSVGSAVADLLKESARDAGTLIDRRAAAAREADRQARLSDALNRVDLRDLPEVPFAAPSEEEYNDVDWPTFWEYQPLDDRRSGNRDREEDSPRPITLPDDGKYIPGPPRSRDGRLTLIYFWTPEEGMAAWNTFYDQMQQIQRQHERDLVVVGVAVEFSSDNRRRRGDEQEERERELEESRERFNEFFDRKPLNHTILDQIGTSDIYKVVVEGGDGRRSRSQDRWLPYLALVSSDGQLRWHGLNGTDRDRFRHALSEMLENDPGVQARRAAEQEFIKQRRADGNG